MADTLTLLTRDQIGILFWSSVQFNTLFCTQHSGLCAHSDVRSRETFPDFNPPLLVRRL